MPDSNAPEEALPQGYQVAATIVMPLPADRAYPLRRLDFLRLCDGASGDETAGKHLCIGAFITALIGMVGLLSCVDWPTVFVRQRWPMLLSFAVLMIFAAASAYGWIVHSIRLRRENTPYTRVKHVILEFFEIQASITN